MELTSEFFNKGDVVKLKSGGPEMIVEGYKQTMDMSFLTKKTYQKNTTKVTCRWFNGDELKRADFENTELDLIEKV